MCFRHIASAIALVLAATAPAAAQDLPNADTAIAPLIHGALVYHGNYCGPGNKGVHPAPVDALDEACMRHDACTTDFKFPSCTCDNDLQRSAIRISADPRAPTEEREAAQFTASGVTVLPCQH